MFALREYSENALNIIAGFGIGGNAKIPINSAFACIVGGHNKGYVAFEVS
jgi:hypothetical protein